MDKPLTIQGGTLYLTGHGQIKAAAGRVTFRGVTFEGNHYELLNQHATHYTGWRFEHCTFRGIKLSLRQVGRIVMNGSTATTGTVAADVIGCAFADIRLANALEIAGWSGLTLANNTIRNIGMDASAGDGIKLTDNASGNVVSENMIRNCTKDGIDAASTHDNQFQRNDISDVHSVGIDLKTIAGQPASYGHIVEANHIHDSGAQTIIEGVFGFGADGLIVRENTITNIDAPAGTGGLYVDGDGCTVTGNQFSGWEVDMYLTGNATNLNADVLTANDYDTLADYRE